MKVLVSSRKLARKCVILEEATGWSFPPRSVAGVALIAGRDIFPNAIMLTPMVLTPERVFLAARRAADRLTGCRPNGCGCLMPMSDWYGSWTRSATIRRFFYRIFFRRDISARP